MEEKKVKRYLRCDFTEKELKGLADGMAQSVADQEIAKTGLKAVKSEFDSKIKIAQATITLTAGQIRTGFEMRNVECTVKKDFKKGRVIIQRDDTYETIEDRAMTAEEKQQAMDFKKNGSK